VLNLLPHRVKESVYYAHYHTRHREWGQLFKRAPLALCPEIAMYDLVPGDVISGCIAFNGFYEWSLTKRIAQAAGGGGLFVDVGANMGYFSLLWVGLSRSNKAIAFEAAPRNIVLFQNNVEQNHLEDRITIVSKAVSDRAGRTAFDLGPADQTGWGGFSTNSATATVVPTVRLDEELPDAKIDVLKIDTEGADTLVLLGCERLLRNRRIQIIYFEQNEPRMKALGVTANTAQSFLHGHGYNCRPLGSNRNEWLAYPG
jgi:FkbM family methyltransferase